MRILIQRVRRASVTIGGELHSAIGMGLLVFVGIEEADDEQDIGWLTGKLTKLRIFADELFGGGGTGGDHGRQSVYAARDDEEGEPTVVYPGCPTGKGERNV